MKKMISILITLTMLITSLGMTAVQAADSSNLIFDLDFETNTDNTGNGYIDAISDGGKYEDTIPDTEKFLNTSGKEISYMNFEAVEQSKNYIVINPNDDKASTFFTQNAETTVETWIRIDSGTAGWKDIFQICPDNQSDNKYGSWMLDMADGKDLYYCVDNGSPMENGGFTVINAYDASDILDKWAHIVFTRTVDEANNKVTAGMYINGVLVGSNTASSATNYFTGSTSEVMMFGSCGHHCSSGMFKGDLAEFKVYNTVLTDTEISTLYSEEASTYEVQEEIVEEADDAVFKLDLSDGTIKDGTGNSTVVTSTNAPVVSEDKTYITFDPSNSTYFGVQNTNLLNQQGTTVEFWYRSSNLPTSGNWGKAFTVQNSSAGAGTSSWRAEIWGNTTDTANYIVAGHNGTGITGTRDFGAYSDWKHIVLTREFDSDIASGDYSSAVYTIYINGKVVGTNGTKYPDEYGVDMGKGNGYGEGLARAFRATAGKDAEDALFWFGALPGSNGTGNTLYGDMSGIKVYNRAFTYAEASGAYTAAVDTYFPDNFEANHKILDIDITNNNGTATVSDTAGYILKTWNSIPSAGTYTSETEEGSVDYAQFSGTAAEYIGIGAGEYPHPVVFQKDLTAEMWVKMENIQDSVWPKFFALSNNGTRHWSIEAGSANDGYICVRNQVPLDPGQVARVNGVGEAISNKWAHVVTSRGYDTDTGYTTYKLYINGKLLANTTQQIELPQSNAIMIGGSYWNSATDHFKGKISDIKMYDVILSDEEIASRYNAKSDFYISAEEKLANEVAAVEAKASFEADVEGYTGSGNFYTTAGTSLSNWQNSTAVGKATALNKAGNTVHYYDFTENANQYFGIGASQSAARALLINKDELSVEMWVRADDILENNTSNFRTPFVIYNAENSSWGNAKTTGSWYIAVENGGLQTYSTGAKAQGAAIDLKDYEGEFVHVIMTRSVDEANSQISYKTYFNGELKVNTTETVDAAVAAAPDGSTESSQGWFLGDYHWESTAANYFDGAIAKFKVYNTIMPDKVAAYIYNSEKDDYTIDRFVEVTSAAFLDSSYLDIYDLNEIYDGTLIASVNLTNNTKDSKTYYTALAVYNGNKLHAIGIDSDTILSGNSVTATPGIEGLELSAGMTAKIFIWSADSADFMKPYLITGENVTTEIDYTASAQEGA